MSERRNPAGRRPPPVDPWDVWVRRVREIMFQLVFPLVGVGILIAVPETIQANPWSWAVVAGLIFSLPAGIADKAYRSLKGGDDDK